MIGDYSKMARSKFIEDSLGQKIEFSITGDNGVSVGKFKWRFDTSYLDNSTRTVPIPNL